MVEPVDPFKSREFHCLEAPPWSTPVDDLSLVETVDRFGEGVVVTVADASDGMNRSGFAGDLNSWVGGGIMAPSRRRLIRRV